jgi:hypothetical protein
LAKVNKAHGLAFSKNGTTVFGWKGILMFFDQANRKIMVYDNGSYTLHDFSYLTGWKLTWQESLGERGSKYSNVRIEFRTSDIKRPLIRIPVFSKTQADEWDHRLALILWGKTL